MGEPKSLSIADKIFIIRGCRVMTDFDLADIYGVTTKRLNEQVKRNILRFPPDFMFRLSKNEAVSQLRSRSQFATLKRGLNIKYSPFVFTEHGAVMLAGVLNSRIAIKASIAVVRAFMQLRASLKHRNSNDLRLSGLENAVSKNSADIEEIFTVLGGIGEKDNSPKKRGIGFIPPP